MTNAYPTLLFAALLGAMSSCDRLGFSGNDELRKIIDTSAVQTEWTEEEAAIPDRNSEAKVEGEEHPPKKETAAGTAKRSSEPPVTKTKQELSKNRGVSSEPMKSFASTKRNSTPYFIQVGAFLDGKNAASFVQFLRKKGYAPKSVELVSRQKTWHAVRMGGFADGNRALKKAKEISDKENIKVALIQNGKVKQMVRPGRKELLTSGKATEKRREGGGAGEVRKGAGEKRVSTPSPMYTFQVGGLLSKENALKQKRKLLEKGYPALIAETPDAITDDIWSTVQVGRYATLLEADKAAREFFREEKIMTQARHIYDFYRNY